MSVSRYYLHFISLVSWALGVLLAIAFVFSQSICAQETYGEFEMGEGGEVVITKDFVVKEVSSEIDDSSLLAVGSALGQHLLYDRNQLSMAGFWSGQFGRLNGDGEFEPNLRDLKSFSLDRVPWTYGENPRIEVERTWRGLEIRGEKIWFLYRLDDPDSDMFWEVEETLVIESTELQHLHFNIRPSGPSEKYLNYWLHQTDFRRVSTNGQQNQRNRLKNLLPNQTQFTISFYRKKETPTYPNGYSVRSIDIPSPKPPFRFEPTDIDFGSAGEVYTSNRTGQVWKRQDGEWSLFADGLHEINGVRVAPDGKGIYVMQRPELTYLKDTNGDGTADLYKTIEDRFRYTGNYHEFAYGPRINAKGEMFFSTGLSAGAHFSAEPKGYPNQMTSALGYRGWVMKRSGDGTLTPFASGLRSPAGIGMNAKDELFITDNQGDWVASSYLGHVEAGDFMGHPASRWDLPEFGLTPRVLDFSTVEKIPDEVPYQKKSSFENKRKLPAVWLAHVDLTNSPGHPSFAPENGFGPFGGQVFIADIAHRNIVRVALEKVNGEYQGAVFPFIRPLRSSSYSTAFDTDGNLWVGSVGRGWTGGDPAIEIIEYDDLNVPFEMHRIELTQTGFDIHFTQPLGDEAILPENLLITEYDYKYWDGYGSEPIMEKTILVDRTKTSTDRMTLSLELKLREPAIYQIQFGQVTSASGLTLENNYGIYTLNQLVR